MPPQSRGKIQPADVRQSSAPTLGNIDLSDSDSPDGDTTRSLDNKSEVQGEDTESDGDSYSSRDQESLNDASSGDGKRDSSSHSTRKPASDDATRPSLTPRSQSSGPAAFAPPFYNRPPTPLPPSPSLTSLLRPRPFSGPLSHTSTPDSSDTEATGISSLDPTSATVAQSAHVAATMPRASPKVPTYEYYGFVVYLGSSFAFLMYLLWSYLPTPLLHQLGIYYYPNRWWSIAVPAWLVVLVLYIYVALAAWNTGVLTLPLNSLECIVDETAQIAVVDAEGKIISSKGKGAAKSKAALDDPKVHGRKSTAARKSKKNAAGELTQDSLNWKEIWSEGTDAVMDIPIGGVCEVLYGSDRD